MNRHLNKYFLSGVLLFSLNVLNAQVLNFHHGEVQFYTASILSDIEAFSKEMDVKLDTQTGNIELTININSFEFEYDLMKEHFEEKHMETDKYPQVTFKGKVIQDISDDFIEMDVDVSGKLKLHGVSKDIDLKAQITKKEDYTIVTSKKLIVFKDFNIKEPSVLTKSVAKDVIVKSTIYLK